MMQMQLVAGESDQLRVIQRPDPAGNLPSDAASFRLALLGKLTAHRFRQCLQIATGDLVLVLPIEPADSTAALAAMLQVIEVEVQLCPGSWDDGAGF